MTRSVVAWSLKFRALVVLVAAGTLIVGVTQLRGASVDVLPEFTPGYVEIQIEALGLSASEVEQLITVPFEGDLLNGVAGIDVIRSQSVAGLSSIVLVFEPGMDLMAARQLVQERLTQAHALPNVSKPATMLQPLSSSSRVMMIGLRSEELSLIDLGLLARWTIRPRLLGVPGVANVAIWGHREHQLQVQVDPERLRRNNVSLQQVISTAGNAQLVSPLSFLEASTPGSGGFIDTPNQRLQIRHILPVTKPKTLAQVPVEGADAKRLGEVATIVEDHQPLIGDASVGEEPGLVLVVEKFPSANTLEVTHGVEDALAALRPGLSGVEIDSRVFRPASFIENALDNLALALVAGASLLAVALAALLREWRVALVSVVSILLSLTAAMLVLHLRGETMNALVLAGLVLAIAVIVDDTIVGAEAVWRRLREARGERDGGAASSAVLEASVEARSPLAFATLVALLAVVPVFVLEGPSGAFFEPLALSYALAVVASMAVALTVTPALSLLFLRNARREEREPPFVHRLKRRYRALATGVHRRPRHVLAAAALLTLAAAALLPRLDYSVVPTFKESQLLIQFDGAPGTSRPEMVRITNRAGHELRQIPGVRNVGAHVGRAVMADQISGINAAELWVTIDRDADYNETVDAVREVVDGYPGLDREVVTYSEERVRAVGAVSDGNVNTDNQGMAALSGQDEPVAVRIYGKDLGVLQDKANEVRKAIAAVDGVVDPRVESQPVEPTIEVQVDLEAAGRVGIKPGDVRRAAATFVQGIAVGALFEEQKVFDVIVIGVPEVRESVSTVRRLLVESPTGQRVRLDDVADVRIAPTPLAIRREAASRRIDVLANIHDRDLDAVLGDVEQRVAKISFPVEYHAELLREASEREAADRRTLAFAIAAAVGIVLLLHAALGSWRLAAAFLLVLPLALVGGVLAAFLAGGTMTLGSLLGLFAVAGIAVRHGVLVFSDLGGLQHHRGAHLTRMSVSRAVEQRLMPVVATACAVGLAFLPLVLLGDIPGHEIVHPMAIVIVGGLVSSTAVALFIMPALYLWLARATTGPLAGKAEPAAGRSS